MRALLTIVPTSGICQQRLSAIRTELVELIYRGFSTLWADSFRIIALRLTHFWNLILKGCMALILNAHRGSLLVYFHRRAFWLVTEAAANEFQQSLFAEEEFQGRKNTQTCIGIG